MSPSTPAMVICDAHVHIYDCFDLDDFLDSAWQNFRQSVLKQQAEDNFTAVLMLTEAKQDHWFLRLKNNDAPTRRWVFEKTNEPDSLYAVNNKGHKILVISGRQIVTSENLEVLALATANELPDGESIASVIEWVLDNNAIPVIPWGFGKWWGQRGEVLSETLDSFTAETLFLGDNSGRPWFLGQPKHFARAKKEQRRLLPGSDPLPFASESWRPGSVGFHFNAEIDAETPATSLRHHLINPNTIISNYMYCEHLIPFMRNQIAMQIRKRI